MDTCAANVSIQTMSAIVSQESNFNPYAIGVNGDYTLEKQPTTKKEALEVVEWLAKQDITNIDLGLGQISKGNRKAYGITPEEAFDPCRNVQVSGAILTDNYRRALNSGLDEQDALKVAISEYNTGSTTAGFSNGYVQKIINKVQIATIFVPDLIKEGALISAQPKELKGEEQLVRSEYKENVYLSDSHSPKIYPTNDHGVDPNIFVYNGR